MTPERAAYHVMMLNHGFWEEFDRDFSEALDQEDPLSQLTLALTDVASDANGAIAVLLRFCMNHQPDLYAVYDLVWADLCRRYRSGSLTDETLSELCWNLAEFAEEQWQADWDEFQTLAYQYEGWIDQMVSDADYQKCRELFLAQHHNYQAVLFQKPKKKTIFQHIFDFLQF